MQLTQLKCTLCRRDDPPLSDAEIFRLHRETPQWEVKPADGIRLLERAFTFKNFRQAVVFVNHVGRVAEEEHHHPAIFIEYDQVTLRWWTHKVGGLHMNDFIMAAKVDAIYQTLTTVRYHYVR